MEKLIVLLVVMSAVIKPILKIRKKSRRADTNLCADSGCPLARRCQSEGMQRDPGLVASLMLVFVLALNPGADANDLVGYQPAVAERTDGGIELTIEDSSHARDWKTRETLLGDLGGLRPWLAERGIDLELNSIDEGLSHASGGTSGESGSSYHGLTDLVINFDTEAAGLWQGGRFSVDLQNVRGGDISECVGDVQGVSNIVGPPGTRFVEYYFEQASAQGDFRVKIGKQDANSDFVVTESTDGFLNSSFGLVPTVPIPTFPAPALGAMAGWQITDSVEVKGGIWDGASELGSDCFRTAFDGSGGTVSAAEVESQLFGGNVLPAVLKVGVWHHSEVETHAKSNSTGSASGAYLAYDQTVWQRHRRSIDVFVQGGWTEPDSAIISRFIGLGAVMKNPFSTADGEVLGLALGRASIGRMEGTYPHGTEETVIEAFYAHPLTPWVTLKPDLQLVREPGAQGRDSIVIGLRMETIF